MVDPSFRFQLSELSPSASPRAVSIKKKTIQTHKHCITRPLNNIKNDKSTLPKISPENLIRRSKDLRLALISTGQNPRSSVLSISHSNLLICNPIDSRYQSLSQNVPLGLDEEYVQKATVKCADWLITNVFDKTYDKSD